MAQIVAHIQFMPQCMYADLRRAFAQAPRDAVERLMSERRAEEP